MAHRGHGGEAELLALPPDEGLEPHAPPGVGGRGPHRRVRREGVERWGRGGGGGSPADSMVEANSWENEIGLRPNGLPDCRLRTEGNRMTFAKGGIFGVRELPRRMVVWVD